MVNILYWDYSLKNHSKEDDTVGFVFLSSYSPVYYANLWSEIEARSKNNSMKYETVVFFFFVPVHQLIIQRARHWIKIT